MISPRHVTHTEKQNHRPTCPSFPYHLCAVFLLMNHGDARNHFQHHQEGEKRTQNMWQRHHENLVSIDLCCHSSSTPSMQKCWSVWKISLLWLILFSWIIYRYLHLNPLKIIKIIMKKPLCLHGQMVTFQMTNCGVYWKALLTTFTNMFADMPSSQKCASLLKDRIKGMTRRSNMLAKNYLNIFYAMPQVHDSILERCLSHFILRNFME